MTLVITISQDSKSTNSPPVQALISCKLELDSTPVQPVQRKIPPLSALLLQNYEPTSTKIESEMQKIDPSVMFQQFLNVFLLDCIPYQDEVILIGPASLFDQEISKLELENVLHQISESDN
ncbi:UNKNOWN [Stylonychia lemnae]|uniref:Uncharacterized protein n=1 Tax=Stylonychia lemnae TaxID=5949 RepID=A0A077ZZP5_STYLE|nr:UNKNOWN [Stylonychia lemnae]|eukprot:CDW73998.1 UNKNOWN [Stylonychia lemnae]